ALYGYLGCLHADPACVDCLAEVGEVYFAREEWGDAVRVWEATLARDPGRDGIADRLAAARERFGGGSIVRDPRGPRIPIGTASASDDGPLQLRLVARFQNYDPAPTDPADHYDPHVASPKSVRFLPDGDRVYVNALEGFETLVYDPIALVKIGVVPHTFAAPAEPLFGGVDTVFGYPYNRTPPDGAANRFSGKPVESELSHGHLLWVPYYRRDWDVGGTSPSAVAIVDTDRDRIVRVLPTGPIPKYVAASPDGQWVAITHWGDNTLGIVDTRGGDPASFAYLPDRLVVEQALPQDNLANQDRDSACGLCLRGTVFTPDSRTLLVARMGGGGIAGFSAPHGRRRYWAYLGTVTGEPPTPRHLVVSADGEDLYVSSNRSGFVSRIGLQDVVDALHRANGGAVALDGWTSTRVGGGARTIELSPDGRTLFVAVNDASELVAVDVATMAVVARVRTDSFTVGLAVSPDGRRVWTTSQGRGGAGGNSVCVYDVVVAEAP
ncbi:MAG: beta-propeller fold lactonase family protein, partial [Myxococcota bacterium]